MTPFHLRPTRAQIDLNYAASNASRTAMHHIPRKADIVLAHSLAYTLASLLSVSPSRSAAARLAELEDTISSMLDPDEISQRINRAVELYSSLEQLVDPTAEQLVHDTAIKENVVRTLGEMKTGASWKAMGAMYQSEIDEARAAIAEAEGMQRGRLLRR
jgi:hypothetical protein